MPIARIQISPPLDQPLGRGRRDGSGHDQRNGDELGEDPDVADQDRGDQPARRDGRQELLGGRRLRLRGSGGGRRAPGQREQPESQRLDLALAEVGEATRVAGRAAHPQAELRDADQPGETRAHDVDRLELREGEAQRPAADQTGLDQDVVLVDPPPGHEPRDESEHDQEPDDRELDDRVVGVGSPAEQRRQQHDGDRDRPAAAAHDRRQRVQPPPLALVHRPAASASPSSASRSRRRAASARLRPGMRASLAAAAVCMCTVASPKDRSNGPALTSMNCIRP